MLPEFSLPTMEIPTMKLGFPPRPVDGHDLVPIWILLAIMTPPALVFYIRLFVYLFWMAARFFRGLYDNLPAWNFETVPTPDPEPPVIQTESRRVRRWPESIKIGSELFSSQWPKFQLIIWDKDGAAYKPIACAFRVSDYVITASHCLVDPKTVALSTDVGDVCVLDYETVYNADELAIIKIHPTFFTENKVAAAKLSPDIDGVVRVTGCDVKTATSCGILKPTTTFSLLSYSGTTKPGFSGAPYIVGDTKIVAMHICGGADGNLCIQGSYIKLIMSNFVNQQPAKQKKKKPYEVVQQGDREPEKKKGKSKKGKKRKTTDWYSEEITSATKIRYRRSRYDPEEYEVLINGNYYLMDASQLRELKGRAHAQNATVTPDFEAKSNKKKRRHNVCESANLASGSGIVPLREDSDSSDSESDDSSTDSDDESAFLGQQSSSEFYKTLGLKDTELATRLVLSQEQRTVLLLMKTLLNDSMSSLESRILNNTTPQTSKN